MFFELRSLHPGLSVISCRFDLGLGEGQQPSGPGLPPFTEIHNIPILGATAARSYQASFSKMFMGHCNHSVSLPSQGIRCDQIQDSFVWLLEI
jgi:hypothetical protein